MPKKKKSQPYYQQLRIKSKWTGEKQSKFQTYI